MGIKKYFETDGHLFTYIRAEKEFLPREKNLVKMRAAKDKEFYWQNFLLWILFLFLPTSHSIRFGWQLQDNYR